MKLEPPNEKPADHVARFDDVAQTYDDHIDRELFLAGGNANFFYEQKARLIEERLRAFFPHTLKVLDFGCGTGKLLQALQSKIPHMSAVGFDPSQQSVTEAQRKFQSPQIKFVNQLNPRTSDFDVVVAAGVFHHVSPQAWEATMESLSGYLKPNGFLFIFEHNPWSPPARLVVALSKVDKGACLLRPSKTRSIMRSVGFRTPRVEYISFFPSFLGPLNKLEKYLTPVPLGAQYICWAQKT